MSQSLKPTFYAFIDESGDFNFAANGTKYFTLTALSVVRPFPWEGELASLKYDLLEEGLNLEYFHAAEDRQAVRNQVFQVIRRHLPSMRLDSVIVEKRKTAPTDQAMDRFYSWTLGHLVRHVVGGVVPANARAVLVTDRIPVNAKRRAVEKAIKTTLSGILPPNSDYAILHHDSKSCGSLQVVDYCNWAIYRKWKGGDLRSYDPISLAIRSELDIFNQGEHR